MRPGAGPRGQFYDNRYNHGRYYPSRGAVFRELPAGYRPYFFHGSPFYFSAGIWYAPGPGGFMVVRPPVGLYSLGAAPVLLDRVARWGAVLLRGRYLLPVGSRR